MERETYDGPAVGLAGPTAGADRAVERRASQDWPDTRSVGWIVVAALSVAGLALRALIARENVFADELSTYWIATTKGLGEVLSTVHSNAEITPPLSFVVAWLATQVDVSGEALRVPSLIAGVAIIPAIYAVGRRTAGRQVGLLAAAFTTLAPFMVYYSAEARGYALMMACLTLSLLSLLLALDAGSARWWVGYAVFTCAAMYTHYTCIFVLGVQLLWVLWAHPDARRPALVATAAAALAYLPWISGLLNDLSSPTTDILSSLQPFDLHNVRLSLEHWTVGYPYPTRVGLRELPGVPALVMLALAALLTVGGLVLNRAQALKAGLVRADRRVLLLFALALATPVCAALFSAVGSTSVFGTRNLAPSWPALALAVGFLIFSAGPRLRLAAAGLVVAALAIGAVTMLDEDFQRPQYGAAADFVQREARTGDVVIDETAVLSPGPLSHLDLVLSDDGVRVLRSLKPAQRDHPFTPYDRSVPRPEAAAKAVAASNGRIFLVTYDTQAAQPISLGPYREVESRAFPGFVGLVARVYERPGGRSG